MRPLVTALPQGGGEPAAPCAFTQAMWGSPAAPSQEHRGACFLGRKSESRQLAPNHRGKGAGSQGLRCPSPSPHFPDPADWEELGVEMRGDPERTQAAGRHPTKSPPFREHAGLCTQLRKVALLRKARICPHPWSPAHHTHEPELGQGTRVTPELGRPGAPRVAGETHPETASAEQDRSPREGCATQGSFLEGQMPGWALRDKEGSAKQSAEGHGEGGVEAGNSRCEDAAEQEAGCVRGNEGWSACWGLQVCDRWTEAETGTKSSATIAEDGPCCCVIESQDATGGRALTQLQASGFQAVLLAPQ